MPRIYKYTKPKTKFRMTLDLDKAMKEKDAKAAAAAKDKLAADKYADTKAYRERTLTLKEDKQKQANEEFEFKKEDRKSKAAKDKSDARHTRWERGKAMADNRLKAIDRQKKAKNEEDKKAAEQKQKEMEAPLIAFGYLKGNRPELALKAYNLGREGDMMATQIFWDEQSDQITALVPGAKNGKEHITGDTITVLRDAIKSDDFRGVGSKGTSKTADPPYVGKALAGFAKEFDISELKTAERKTIAERLDAGEDPQIIADSMSLEGVVEPEPLDPPDNRNLWEKLTLQGQPGMIEGPTKMTGLPALGQRPTPPSPQEPQQGALQMPPAAQPQTPTLSPDAQQMQVMRKQYDILKSELKNGRRQSGAELDGTDQRRWKAATKQLEIDIDALQAKLQGGNPSAAGPIQL